MIRQIKIQNFECWKEAEINLHSGINVLLGESDEGKSSIIRALELIFNNRPQGFVYRSDFVENKKEVTSIGVELLSEGKIDTIIRQRDLAGINNYLLNNKPLMALRTDVPTEISEITKMSSINIQGQHPTEQYFLLTEKPGYVAKEFNKVSGLSIMDDALSEVNSQVRSANSELKVIQKEIDSKKESIEKTKWITKAIEFAEKLEKLQKEIEKKKTRVTQISDVLIQLEQIKQKLSETKNVRKAINHINKLINLELDIRQIEEDKKDIENSLKSIKNADLMLETSQHINEALNDLKTLEKEPELIQKEQDKYIQLKSILSSVEKNDIEVEKLNQEIDKYEKIFHHKLKTEQCPVCGRIG